jgi:hypothetical protein
VPSHKEALDRIDKLNGLAGAEEKLVPDVLDGDDDAEFFGERDGLPDFGGGAGKSVRIAGIMGVGEAEEVVCAVTRTVNGARAADAVVERRNERRFIG